MPRQPESFLKFCEAELSFQANRQISRSITESLLPELRKDRAEISDTDEGFRILLRNHEVGRLRAMVGGYLRLVASTMRVLQEVQ